MSLMLAINVQAVELSRDFSQSFARRRHLPSHELWLKLGDGA